ncbi:uncharacterized protein F4807DRAFT_458029 [Annulohypoxylon truncatum]|uniref:uncharacterized protein n=1 Tax=Annulohypoxylon truncatum TaxID=327061 RepID=UPI00200738D5|nr:uncharacterized protein F4807DRAFT_458029 [Annulohypoxylon truncatum]KAI1211822.1 hypothetical protein F4807DRAFT_458029 [Annulohypoxylon truncatum]
MLNQIVLAALMPAVMASPIAQRSQSAVPSGMGGVMYHNNIPTAAAHAMDMDTMAMKNAALQKIKHNNKDASQTKNHARAPEPTVFVAPTQVVGRQINTTMLEDMSKNAVSFATGIAESIASGLANLPPSKRADKPASTSSAPLAAPTNGTGAMNATELAKAKCDCVGACSDIDGKSKQMKCIKECAKECDGDDDTKEKKDPVKNLLGSLGLREVTPAQIEHAKRPKPMPVKVTAAAGEEAFEECMKNCKSHNCQHSSVGLSIDQCGKTSCEETCAKHKKSASFGKKISKKGHPENWPLGVPKPKPASAPKHEAAAAKKEEEYESCMKECKTHNCQHSSVGLSVDQCGDTFCEDGCAKFRKAASFASEKTVHKTYLRAVDSYPTKPEPKPKHDVSVAGKESEEFEACMKECKTHNCQHSGVGLDVDQCGDTMCADSCAEYKHAAAGAIHGGMHPRDQLNYPSSPRPVPQPAAIPAPKPVFKSHPPPTHKTASMASENEEFEACMKECKTHNCQHSSVGLSIDQCGDTACADACAGYKKSAKAGHKHIHKKQVEPVPKIEALPAVPAVAPLPAVERLPAVPAVAPLPAVPNVAVAPNAAPAPDRPATPAPASPAGPGSHPPPDVPVAAKKGSEDFEACMKQCKSHNCQHTSVGLETEQCGKTSCEDECASYHEADAAVAGKQMVKEPGAKLVANPGLGPDVLAVPNVHDVPVAEGHASQEYEDCMKKCKTHNCQKTGVGLDTEQCGDTSCEEKCVKGHSDAAFRAHGKA